MNDKGERNVIHVTMLGTAPGGRGGVSSVVTQFLKHDWGGTVELKQIDTHVSGPGLWRAGVFLASYVRLLGRLLLHGERVDVVHMHMSGNGSFYRKYLLHRLVKRFGKKDVIHLHASRFQTFYHAADKKVQRKIRRLLRECDRVLVLGGYWQRTILEIEPEAKVEILKNAVKIPEDHATWQEDIHRLIYLGTLDERKGLPDLLQALQILNEERPALAARLRLVIAGSGIEEAALRQLAAHLGIAGQVEFTGWIDGERKHALLKSGQCMVLPSYDEGLPVAILEALSYGLPVVSTDVGSVADAVVDGRNGYLVPTHAPERIASAIAAVFADRARWESLSEEAQKTVRMQFEEGLMFQRLERLYREVMEEGGS